MLHGALAPHDLHRLRTGGDLGLCAWWGSHEGGYRQDLLCHRRGTDPRTDGKCHEPAQHLAVCPVCGARADLARRSVVRPLQAGTQGQGVMDNVRPT